MSVLLLLAAGWCYAVNPQNQDVSPSDSLRQYDLDTLRVIGKPYSSTGDLAPVRTINMPAKIRHYNLETVRIIGEVPAETIGSLSIKKLDSEAQSAPLNLKDSMQNIGGISITVGTKDESNLRIRGFRKNEVLILVDGRPLNAGYFGGVDLQNMPVSDLKEIRILKGPVSSIYGSNTMGGVVNLISGQPSTRKWLKIGSQFQRNNTNHLELSTSHSFDNWNYWLYGARDNTAGFVLSQDFVPTANENGDVRNNLNKTQYNFQMRTDTTWRDWHTVGAAAGYTFINKKQIPRSIYGIGEEYRLYRDWSRYQSTLLGKFLLTENIELNSMLYLDGGQDTYQSYTDAGYQHLNVNSTMQYWTLGFNPRLECQINAKTKLQSGLRSELLHSTRKDNGNYPDWTPHSLGLTNVFSQLEYAINKHVNLSGGMGVALFKTDMRKSIATYAEPSLGIYYAWDSGARVSLAGGWNSSYPTMRQLFSADKGNPDLKPQSSGKYEVSFSQPFAILTVPGSLGSSVFYNDTHNLIDLSAGKYANINRVKSEGCELNLALQPFVWWELDGNYAWLEFDRQSDYKLTESPANSAELRSVLRLPAKLTLALTSTFKDNRLSLDAANHYRTLPAYWVHGVEVKRSWRDIRFSLGLANFTDAYYEEEYGFPAPGIDFHLGLEAEI